MERRRLKPVALFSSDLDGTLAGNPAAVAAFRQRWEALPPEGRPVLVYNSGRLVDDLLDFSGKVGLPQPDYAIGGVGTLLADPRDPTHLGHFAERFAKGWSLEQVNEILRSFAAVELQPDIYQHAYKSSWYLHDAEPEMLARIETALKDAGLVVTMIYSSRRDLDILPGAAGKGQALTWLCTELGLRLDETVVAGDTDNDRSMFELPDVRGIVVANALPELRSLSLERPLVYAASKPFAFGVIEGLDHWSVFSDRKDTP